MKNNEWHREKILPEMPCNNFERKLRDKWTIDIDVNDETFSYTILLRVNYKEREVISRKPFSKKEKYIKHSVLNQYFEIAFIDHDGNGKELEIAVINAGYIVAVKMIEALTGLLVDPGRIMQFITSHQSRNWC
jgi:hypothetical protein